MAVPSSRLRSSASATRPLRNRLAISRPRALFCRTVASSSGSAPGGSTRAMIVVGDVWETLLQLIMADISPSLWKAVRIATASASLTMNITGAWTTRPKAGKHARRRGSHRLVRPEGQPASKARIETQTGRLNRF